MRVLIEKEAEAFLEKKGFKVVKRQLIGKKEQLKNLKIGFPIVMKASSKKIIHKAKLGGVIINIKSVKQAEKAFDELKKIKNFEEALVQEQIKGQELILGLKNTPEFGLAIMLGKGGSEVEKAKDISFRICPIKKKDAGEMIKEIKFYNILKNKKANFNALRKNLLKLSDFAQKHPHIEELDINPLMINKKEAVVVDARIIF